MRLPHCLRCRELTGGPATLGNKATEERVQNTYLMSSIGINTATIPHNHSAKQVLFLFKIGKLRHRGARQGQDSVSDFRALSPTHSRSSVSPGAENLHLDPSSKASGLSFSKTLQGSCEV